MLSGAEHKIAIKGNSCVFSGPDGCVIEVGDLVIDVALAFLMRQLTGASLLVTRLPAPCAGAP